MECYRRAMIPEQRFEGRGENLNQANKLSHTSVVAARPNILREAARRCAPAPPSAVRILAYRLQADRLGDLDTGVGVCGRGKRKGTEGNPYANFS
jgi:hypothetical protein